MLTLGDLLASPERVAELEDHAVLIAAAGAGEVLITPGRAMQEGTMIFEHETIRMMMADRAAQLDSLRRELDNDSPVMSITQKPGSMWESVTLGRASTADLIVDDPAISQVHAHFEVDYEEETVSLQDAGSSNGTHVNRVPLQPHTPMVLRGGDCVRFGQSIFYFLPISMLRDMVAAATG